jgi:diamine N-acetyltransferase
VISLRHSVAGASSILFLRRQGHRLVIGEITVRAAEVGDHDVLAALSAMVQEVHLRERPDVFKPMDVVALERWFRDILATGSARIWIGQVGGQIAGYVLARTERRPENVFSYERRWYEIDQMGVDPRYQREGVARALLGRVIESAIAEDVKDIELNTWSFNEAAQRAFQKLGRAVKNVRFGLTTGARHKA